MCCNLQNKNETTTVSLWQWLVLSKLIWHSFSLDLFAASKAWKSGYSLYCIKRVLPGPPPGSAPLLFSTDSHLQLIFIKNLLNSYIFSWINRVLLLLKHWRYNTVLRHNMWTQVSGGVRRKQSSTGDSDWAQDDETFNERLSWSWSNCSFNYAAVENRKTNIVEKNVFIMFCSKNREISSFLGSSWNISMCASTSYCFRLLLLQCVLCATT